MSVTGTPIEAAVDATYYLASIEKYKAMYSISDADLTINGFKIYCTSNDATAATVEVTSTQVILIITGGDDAGTENLTLEDYTELGDLVDAINALDGWLAIIITDGSLDPEDMVVTASTGCLAVGNEQTLQIVNNYSINLLLSQATDMIEKEIGYKVLSRDYTEVCSGTGRQLLYLENGPVTAIKHVSCGTNAALTITYSGNAVKAVAYITTTGVVLVTTTAGVESETEILFTAQVSIDLMATAITAVSGFTAAVISDYGGNKSSDLLQTGTHSVKNRIISFYIPTEAIEEVYIGDDKFTLYNTFGWPTDMQSIRVIYTAGESSVPPGLEAACLELVKIMQGLLSQDLALQSENIGDYSYSTSDIVKNIFGGGVEGVSNIIMTKISQYRRLRLWA